jgi:hypothetical protein
MKDRKEREREKKKKEKERHREKERKTHETKSEPGRLSVQDSFFTNELMRTCGLSF